MPAPRSAGAAEAEVEFATPSGANSGATSSSVAVSMQHLGCRRTLTAGTIRAWEQIVISALHCIPEVFGGNKCEFSEHQFPSSRLSVFVRAALLSRHAGIQGLERVQL